MTLGCDVKNHQSRVISFCIHVAGQLHGLSGEGVGEGQRFCAKKLGAQPQPLRIGGGGFVIILWVAQDGKAHVGAMEPELVGAAGNGTQRQFT